MTAAIETRPLEPDPVDTGEGSAVLPSSALHVSGFSRTVRSIECQCTRRIPIRARCTSDRTRFRCARSRCRAASRRCRCTTRAGRRGTTCARAAAAAARVDCRARRRAVGAAHLHPRFEAARRAAEDALPRRAARQGQRHAAPLRAQGRRHAGDGVHRRARRVRRRVRALGGGARPRDHPGQHQSSRARADDHRPQLPGEDQRQHRQLGRELVDRGRGREAALGDPLGRGHGDGPLHRQGHPRDARVDSAELAGADRHGADLSGARESRRTPGRSHVGDLSRHADRAGRAGRRLLHGPRRRAAALHPDDGPARHRHRVARRIDHGQVVPRASQGELHLHAFPRDLRNHEGLRRVVLARRRAAARLDRRRERCAAVRRARDAGRADEDRVGVRRPGDERRARATCRCT